MTAEQFVDVLRSSGVMEATQDCLKLIAHDGTLLFMNGAGRRALGVDPHGPLGMSWVSLLPPETRVTAEQALQQAFDGVTNRFSSFSVTADGRRLQWDNLLTPVPGIDAIFCVSREMTRELEAIEELRASEERLAMALRVGGLGVWDYDIVADELVCDEQWYRIVGRDPARPIRSLADFEELIHPDDRERVAGVYGAAAELVARGEPYSAEYRVVRPDGEVRWVRSAAHLHHVDGDPRRAVGFVVDITDARRNERALRAANRALAEERTTLARQSLEDALTGLPNRRYLDNELQRISARAGRTGEPMSVGLVDVDHFKAYNDRYGHLAGDDALRRIAAALRSVVRGSDFVARYGGEEFMFVLADTDDPAPVLDRLIKVITDLAITHEDAPDGQLTVSCGCVVVAPRQSVTPAGLVQASDRALYEAKAAGRNRYVLRRFSPVLPTAPPEATTPPTLAS